MRSRESQLKIARFLLLAGIGKISRSLDYAFDHVSRGDFTMKLSFHSPAFIRF